MCKDISAMKKYNFDEIISREGTDALSLERVVAETGRTDILPMWVADMDFSTPDFVLTTIRRRLSQRVLGYTVPSEQYYTSITRWLKHRFGWTVRREWVHYVAGVVPGVTYAINALSEKGDGVLIMNPVYHPFGMTIEATGRKKVVSPLRLVDGRYEMDLADIEQKLPACRLLILCNPHNPGGIVWKLDELRALAVLCEKYKVTVISDEIHADMTLPGHRHVPFARVSAAARRISLTLMAPSKAFNMPGVIASYYVIPDDTLRRRIFTYLDLADIGNGSIFSFACTAACYSRKGENWLNQMLAYVEENIKYIARFLEANCPRISSIKPEASFLMFIDNRELPFSSQQELVHFYVNEARLYLNDGTMFGPEGKGFMRLNVARPRAVIEEAMNRLKAAYDKRGF